MLSDAELQKAYETFSKRYNAVSERYVKLMGEHIKRIGTLTASDVNRLVELRRMNANMNVIRHLIAEVAESTETEIDKIFEKVAESDVQWAKDRLNPMYDADWKNNPNIRRVVEAQAQMTQKEMRNLSQTTIVSQSYINLVDKAVTAVKSGMTDYNSAIKSAMRQAATDGLRVRYESGHTRRLDSAVRMNILDGIRDVNQGVLTSIGEELNTDGIEISAHLLCAEDHAPYQGYQFSNEEFDKLQNSLDRPFGMWNCRHYWTPIFMGITPMTYDEEELKQYRDFSSEEITYEIDGKEITKTRYQWSQVERRIETQIREKKEALIAASNEGNTAERRAINSDIKWLEKQRKVISLFSSVESDSNRTSIAGYNNTNVLIKDTKGVIINKTTRINLQLFAEQDLKNQKNSSLIKGIDSLKSKIELHNNKISNPSLYDPNFDTYTQKHKDGLIRHWKKEMAEFEESIQNRIDELRKRGIKNVE